ncbi:glycosyl transferase family 90 [Marinobacter zhanjiangensis]|uniref:LPS A protein n=1 Tax=Marinobacter zhanjiangensis TaxID=578215 RepID=A0ABQ3AZL8_9GAMM|nr:glycosyl transferase family 90 [Marinobacter zhanjiangensis]GGY72844.1 LPS A protein [Marinobacter zhanjiangensis]
MFGKLSKPLYKAGFYTRNQLRSLVPGEFWRARRRALLTRYERLDRQSQADIDTRVSYYNRLSCPASPSSHWEPVKGFSNKGKSSAYCADFRHLIRHFPGYLRANYRFGDVTEVPAEPAFVKSRPIGSAAFNANSLLLKLNSVRHYHFHQDRIAFRDKRPLAVWRGKSNRDHRIRFAQRFMDHPLCDIGCTIHRENQPAPWHKPFMSIAEQLGYQFVVSVEGIDVATNLKWIMASNSLCLMRRPRFETWFMEGTLVPGYHYVELKDDHSDLPQKIDYYRRHPEQAEAIIANAKRHAARFRDTDREDLIGLLVMERFFQLSGQRTAHPLAVGV